MTVARAVVQVVGLVRCLRLVLVGMLQQACFRLRCPWGRWGLQREMRVAWYWNPHSDGQNGCRAKPTGRR